MVFRSEPPLAHVADPPTAQLVQPFGNEVGLWGAFGRRDPSAAVELLNRHGDEAQAITRHHGRARRAIIAAFKAGTGRANVTTAGGRG